MHGGCEIQKDMGRSTLQKKIQSIIFTTHNRITRNHKGHKSKYFTPECMKKKNREWIGSGRRCKLGFSDSQALWLQLWLIWPTQSSRWVQFTKSLEQYRAETGEKGSLRFLMGIFLIMLFDISLHFEIWIEEHTFPRRRLN